MEAVSKQVHILSRNQHLVSGMSVNPFSTNTAIPIVDKVSEGTGTLPATLMGYLDLKYQFGL